MQGEGHGGIASSNGCVIMIVINNIVVSGEAILSAENGGKPLGGRSSAPNHAGGTHSAPSDGAPGGEGIGDPQEPRPLSAVGSLVSIFGHSVLLPVDVHQLTVILKNHLNLVMLF